MQENILFETHFDIIPFPVYVVDIESYQIIFNNHTFRREFGDHRGKICYKSLYGYDLPCPQCSIDKLVDENGKPNGQTVVFESFNESNQKWYQLQEKIINWPDGRKAKSSMAVDITELKITQNKLSEAHAELAIKNKEMERLSTTDSLTGINNRYKMQEIIDAELARTIRHGGSLALFFLDIDHFKFVNDTYGHQVGDDILRDFVKLVSTNIRKSDFMGRWGGEEFLVLCPETDLNQAEITANKLRQSISRHIFPVAGKVTSSFGVTVSQPEDTVEKMVARADKALYMAKESGRNRVEVETD
ncbi:MAG: GGDEF domain-containing protein [Desulfonatronovibrio sp.]